MSSYEPSSSFHDAASYLSNATALSNVSNAVKLELYGLFKYLTVSPSPTTTRPGIFDFAGRAKWDAWNSAGKSYVNQAADAEQRYLEIAKQLGWKEGAGEEAKADRAQNPQPEGNDDDDDIWDDEDTTSSKKSGGAGGLGTAVSTMAPAGQIEHEEESLHSLARTGNLEGLQTFLTNHPGTDVNGKDENGYTALHLASDRGNEKIVELLINAGADTSIKDEDDFTALELAQVAEHRGVVALLEKS